MTSHELKEESEHGGRVWRFQDRGTSGPQATPGSPPKAPFDEWSSTEHGWQIRRAGGLCRRKRLQVVVAIARLTGGRSRTVVASRSARLASCSASLAVCRQQRAVRWINLGFEPRSVARGHCFGPGKAAHCRKRTPATSPRRWSMEPWRAGPTVPYAIDQVDNADVGSRLRQADGVDPGARRGLTE